MKALNFYPANEDIQKYDSVDNYQQIFIEYSKKVPSIEEALHELFLSTGISDQKAYELMEDILSKAKKVVELNYDLINKKYPPITTTDAIIISSYTCECETEYSNYVNPPAQELKADKIDVIKTLISVYKTKPFDVIWPGQYEEGKLIYGFSKVNRKFS